MTFWAFKSEAAVPLCAAGGAALASRGFPQYKDILCAQDR